MVLGEALVARQESPEIREVLEEEEQAQSHPLVVLVLRDRVLPVDRE
jgi:hypothetical protein